MSILKIPAPSTNRLILLAPKNMFNWFKKSPPSPVDSPRVADVTTALPSSPEPGQQTDESVTYKKQGDQYFAEGKLAEAANSYQQAIAINPNFAEAYNNFGNVLTEQGLFNEAEHCLRQSIQIKPELANAYCNLGALLLKREMPDEAIENLSMALELKPDVEIIYRDLSYALFQAGQHDAAKQTIAKGMALNPNFADFHYFLGNIYLHDNELDQAFACYQRALSIQPDYAEVLSSLGKVFLVKGKLNEAIHCSRRAIELNPNFVDLHFSLGLACQQQGKMDKAITCYREILLRKPGLIEVHVNLGNLLNELGRPDEAIACYQNALTIDPNFVEAHNNLGSIHMEQGRADEAAVNYQRALALRPDQVEVHSNLGGIHMEQGRADKAVAHYRKALSLKPDFVDGHSNLLLTMQYSATLTPQEIFAEHLRFAEQFETPLKSPCQVHANIPDPKKRLKVGYVSPDFRGHSVAYFIEPVLEHHDKSQVEIFCYYNNFAHDRFTDRIKSLADHWVSCKSMSDQQLAEQIRADGIDILIELAGHTAHNRLLTFARRPAPVQATYIGYPTTTGMSTIDYRITDGYVDPTGMTERLNVEQLWRLPGIYCCYQAHENSPEVIDHPPAEDNGYVTFGCFNNFAKVTDKAISVWASLLKRIPSSRLMLKIKGIDSAHFRAEVENRFARLGIPGSSLILIGQQKESPFELYNRIDIALDPFPYNGCTTSLDTLWMGVPFVTLAGETSLSRVGVSVLTNAGLPELIAYTEDSYADIAAALALDLTKLKTMRTGLRERIKHSALMDAPRLTPHLEQAYREMWKKWCADSAAKSDFRI